MNMEVPAKLMVDEILKNNVNPYTVLDIYLEEFKKVCGNYMGQKINNKTRTDFDCKLLNYE
jgi:hypothetical protein